MRPRRTIPGLVLAALLLLSACGADSSPTDAVPELATQLDSVDAAIAAGDYGRARSDLKALSATAARAERTGDLGVSDADRITEAVSALLAELPDEGPTAEPTEEPEVEPSPSEPTESASTVPSAPESSENSGPEPSREEPKPDKDKNEDENGNGNGEGEKDEGKDVKEGKEDKEDKDDKRDDD